MVEVLSVVADKLPHVVATTGCCTLIRWISGMPARRSLSGGQRLRASGPRCASEPSMGTVICL